MRKFTLMLVLLLISTQVILAQSRQITGKVTSREDGNGIPGVSVIVKGTTTGVTTNVDGTYSLTVPQTAQTLVFSFMGMKTVEVPITGNRVDVVMESSSTELSEVMVVGYGVARKESFTGSAEVVRADKIEKRTIANVTKALDGVAPGVQTTSGSGQPGAGSNIIIRGFGSISASTNPLYVVDGIPYDGAINVINPNDIESITIIKDASAGAIYGARGANGVVMVTTKKGKSGAPTLDFKTNWGVSSRAIPRYETQDAFQWTESVYEMYRNKFIASGTPPSQAGVLALNEMTSGAGKIFGEGQHYNPFSVPLDQLFDHTTGKIVPGASLRWDEDWLDAATAKNPLRQEYQTIISGGMGNNKYMISLGYLNEDGLVVTTNFDRYSGRANVDSEIRDWLKTGLNVNFAANRTNSTTLGSGATSSSAYSNVFYTSMLMAPIYPLYQRDANGNILNDADGEPLYSWGDDRPSGASAGWNPLANLMEDKFLGNNDNLSGRTSVTLGGLDYGTLQGLALNVGFGFDYSLGKNKTYYNPYFGNFNTEKGLAAMADGRTFSFTFNQILNWNRYFGDHHFDIMGGHELYKYNYQYLYSEKTGFPFGDLYELAAATTITAGNSYTNNYVIESYISRLNYDFKNKYYLSGSYRRDGTSRFHPDSRWGDFWSLGASWRISQEPFLRDKEWLDNLTLKASYGVQGNDNIGSFYAWQAFYNLAYPNGPQSGAIVSSLENTDLRWEKNENFNTGIEARLFNRMNLTLEYYNRYTRDMLMPYPMAVSLGFDSYDKNIGNLKNSGFEMSLGADLVRNDNFTWNSTFMGSTIKNKVLNLADKPEIISGNYIIKEGETLNSFYLAESAGVDPATGNKLYWVWDENEDGTRGEKYITDDYTLATRSRSIAGSRIPKIYGSWANTLNFYGFDLNLLTTYSYGGKMLDGVYYTLLYNTYVGQTGHIDRDLAWKKPGDIASIPRIDDNGSAKITRTADELIDASYFAIKNITLGYTFPQSLYSRLSFRNLRAFVTADNLHVFTALKGMDPQYNFTGGTGFSYTPSKTISLGINIGF